MKNKLLLLALVILGLCLIVSLSRDIINLIQKEKEIKKSQLEVEELEVKNEELEKQLEYVKSAEFIEKEAREKLGLAREGETIAILPENIEELVGAEKKEKEEELPNWKRWLKLFF